LRITVVTPFLDRRHGTERALAEQLERLVRQYQCEVHLYAQTVEDLEIDDPNTPDQAKQGKLIWHRVPSLRGPHFVQFCWWLLCSGFLRKWSSSDRGPSQGDVVLSAGINCLDAEVIVVHAVFYRLYELLAQEVPMRALRAGFFRRLHRAAYYRLLMTLENRIYADSRISLGAVSHRTADLLGRYFRRHDVEIIPNGVDATQFCPSARRTKRVRARSRRDFGAADLVLLLIGNDWRVKGVPVILSAMATCSHLALRLLVVGDDHPDPYREMANRFGLADRCEWERPRSEVIDLYAAADIYISPSREDSFGLPVLEAMACGLPVITSVFAGVSELIKNQVDGFIVTDPDDTRTLAQLLERLYYDESLRRRIGEAGAQTAQTWTWDKSAEALWNLMKDVVARKKGARSNI
jgi:glycosyltransferase involved in cell wall biosynthesis